MGWPSDPTAPYVFQKPAIKDHGITVSMFIRKAGVDWMHIPGFQDLCENPEYLAARVRDAFPPLPTGVLSKEFSSQDKT